jgi:5,10-methylenetetrahydromethanopterin reductase
MLGTVRIGMTIGGDVLARPSSPPDVVADARRAEEEGFATAWSVLVSRDHHALTTLAVAGTRTSRIELGVGVVPTYPELLAAL